VTRRLDLDTWSRRDHYRFFREFDNPFFSVCVELHVGRFLERFEAYCRAPDALDGGILAVSDSL
jgi:chloramphenicol O-acetyltransferase